MAVDKTSFESARVKGIEQILGGAFTTKKYLETTDDINTITQTGIYPFGDAPINSPQNLTYGILLHVKGYGHNEQQFVLKGGVGLIYTRSLSTVSPRTWSPWKKFQGADI